MNEFQANEAYHQYFDVNRPRSKSINIRPVHHQYKAPNEKNDSLNNYTLGQTSALSQLSFAQIPGDEGFNKAGKLLPVLPINA